MGKRILLVDDNADNRQIVRDLLSRTDHVLVEATTGEDGVRAASRERPDLILMDIELPGLDGFEATRQIKASRDTQAIPVIALTSYALPEVEAKARAIGFAGYVTQPFSPRELLELVNFHLGVSDSRSLQ